MTTRITRRRALQTGAAALPLVHIRSGHAAGKLALAFWDHWVPGGNDVMTKQIAAWAQTNQVEVATDYMSAGNKLVITAAAEEQAKTGHDVIALPVWEVHNHARALRTRGRRGAAADREIWSDQRGERIPREDERPLDGGAEQLGLAEPAAGGPYQRAARQGRARCSAMYPVNGEYTPGADAWTWDAHLKAAEACQKAGMPFALGLSNAGDCVDFCGALFAAYGADLVDAKGNVTVRSDEVRQVLEYGQQLVKVLPREALSFDSASNNRALNSGQSALIFNPPSAWRWRSATSRRWRRTAGRSPRRAGRKGGSSPTIRISGESGRSAATSPRPRTCWNISASASRWRNAPRRSRASTSRRSTAC